MIISVQPCSVYSTGKRYGHNYVCWRWFDCKTIRYCFLCTFSYNRAYSVVSSVVQTRSVDKGVKGVPLVPGLELMLV